MTSVSGPSVRPNRWAVLALLGTAQLMVVLDSTIVNIALPPAQRAFRFSTSDREWVVTAYALAFGSLLLLGGKLGDLFGRRWTFIVGPSGFAIVSAIGNTPGRRPRRSRSIASPVCTDSRSARYGLR
jgi:MFS family permease